MQSPLYMHDDYLFIVDTMYINLITFFTLLRRRYLILGCNHCWKYQFIMLCCSRLKALLFLCFTRSPFISMINDKRMRIKSVDGQRLPQ